MMLRGWSPFADSQGVQIPLKNRAFLDPEQCGKVVELVVQNVSAGLWGLVESVRHDSQRNWQIVLTRRPDSRPDDWWHLLESINDFLKGKQITVNGQQVFCSMEPSPDRRERNKILRAGARAVQSTLKASGLQFTADAEFTMPGSIVVHTDSGVHAVATYSKRKGIKWVGEIVHRLGLSADVLQEALEDCLE